MLTRIWTFSLTCLMFSLFNYTIKDTKHVSMHRSLILWLLGGMENEGGWNFHALSRSVERKDKRRERYPRGFRFSLYLNRKEIFCFGFATLSWAQAPTHIPPILTNVWAWRGCVSLFHSFPWFQPSIFPF